MDKLINESIFLSSDSLKFVQTGGDWNGFFFLEGWNRETWGMEPNRDDEDSRILKVRSEGPLGDLCCKGKIQGSIRPNKLNWLTEDWETVKKNMEGDEAGGSLTTYGPGHGNCTPSFFVMCHLRGLEMVEGHGGHVSGRRVVNQQNALEGGRERRNKHRALIFKTRR